MNRGIKGKLLLKVMHFNKAYMNAWFQDAVFLKTIWVSGLRNWASLVDYCVNPQLWQGRGHLNSSVTCKKKWYWVLSSLGVWDSYFNIFLFFHYTNIWDSPQKTLWGNKCRPCPLSTILSMRRWNAHGVNFRQVSSSAVCELWISDSRGNLASMSQAQ